MRVGIATDHGGFGLKEDLVARLRTAGHEVIDFGAHRSWTGVSQGNCSPIHQSYGTSIQSRPWRVRN